MENVFRGFALGGEVLDEGVDGGNRSNNGSGGCGGGGGLSVSDLLGVICFLGFPLCLRGLAFICTVSFLAASEAKFLPHASAWSAGESFFKWMVSTSMASGSLVGCKLELNEERGRPCPFLRAMI